MTKAATYGRASILVAAIVVGNAAAASSRVSVTMTDRVCVASKRSVAAGTVVFALVNRGQKARALAVAGKRSRFVAPRRRGTLRTTLRPGRHRYSCVGRKGTRAVRGGFLTARRRATPQPPPTPEHQIGVRTLSGSGELYATATGARFVPRGNNYFRLGPIRRRPGEAPSTYHTTFNIGVYDGARAEAALQRMKAGGYNAVRVFLNAECFDVCAVDPATGRVSRAYLANFVDFLRRAKAYGLYVDVTNGFVPQGHYDALINSIPHPGIENVNAYYLAEGGIRADSEFWRDVIRELRTQRAPTDAILVYDIRNEINFVNDAPPFSLSSGTVTTANGKTYNLASQADKDRMIDEGLAYYFERIRTAIRQVDPTALVGGSFFEPQGPNRSRAGDTRIIRTQAVIEASSLDVVDLHPYPGVELTLPQYMQNFGVAGPTAKPIIIGEFGAFRFAYPAVDEASTALQDVQAQSCLYGLDGWLLWTWDTDEQPELWNGLSGGGTIDRALAPATRPDPCAAPTGPRNVALGKPVSASRSLPSNPPALAVNGLKNDWWGSGDFAPQWLEIDLQAPVSLSRIRLSVSQWPSGPTVHRVYVRGAASAGYELLHEFSGVTSDDNPLEHALPSPRPGVRFVRIETLASPSWVSWREIEVIATG